MVELALYEAADGVATVTLNRPEHHNGWTSELQEAFFDQLDRAADDPEVRAIVITGAGRSFCPGGDLQALNDVTESGVDSIPGERPMTHIMSMPKPTIAAINGACAGFGMSLAAMCDLRFAVSTAKFTTSFARRGVAAEHTITYLLPRQIGLQRALDLLMTGRVFLGDEAVVIGFVLEVADDVVGHAQAYAREMAAQCSPLAMAVIRRQVYEDLDQDHETARQGSLRYQFLTSHEPDFAEGMLSFAERRLPSFQPLPPEFLGHPVPPAKKEA